MVVFSHYPTDYLHAGGRGPELLAGLRDASKHHIEYFGGHRHGVDQTSTASIAPNNNWLVGGGGGWGTDAPQQGFIVVEVDQDYVVHTYPVLLDPAVCAS